MYADRQRALYGSWYEFFPRSEGATIDPETGHAVSGNFRTALASGSTTPPTWASTSSTCRRSTRSARSTARAPTTPSPPSRTTPAPRGRSARRTAATTPSTPTSGRSRTSTPSSRTPRASGSRSPSTWRCSAPPTTRGSPAPEWFTTRADGTIAYAENPPKKYQDIYPVNFDNDPTGICREVLRIVKLWMSHGVPVFRVDNPHTKPVAFWEWLLREVRRTDPDVLFLAEAFTRPAMMSTLGAIGYHQSYTYFTWRTAKWEIEDYLRELSHHTDHLMRPNFFVNTPRHPPRVPAVRRPGDVQDPRGARRVRVPELGGLLRLRALRARRGQARQRGVPRLGEVPDPGARLGGAEAEGRTLAPYIRGSTGSAASTPRCSCCAT